ncbi:pyridine nucleotide-disulfide oxidoreductase [Cooperia oncophora]
MYSHFSDEPQPPFVPRPSSGERNWLGSLKPPSEKFPSDPYKPEKSDHYSFIGAGVGILLTVLAVTFYTDLFGKNIMSKGHGSKAHVHEKEEDAPEKEEKVEKLEAHATKAEPEGETQPAESHPEAPTTKGNETTSPTTNEGKAHDCHKEEDPSQKHTEEEHKDAHSHEEKHADSHARKSSPSEEHPSSPVDSKEEKKTVVVSSSGEEVPKSVEYLLIGAGAAAYYASLAIRARHADAKVLMIGEEDHLPYNRPPLSKELWWYGDENAASNLQYEGLSGKKRDIYFEAEGFFVPPAELPSTIHGGVSLLKGHRVKSLNPEEKKAYLDDGTCILYDKCLIATGGKPKTLAELENASGDVKKRVLYLRGIDDYRVLDSLCKSAKSIVIVGGGFIGSESLLNMGTFSGVLPEFLSKKATESLRGFGVDVITNAKITAARKQGEQLEVQVNGSKPISSDYIIVCIGIQPDTAVAEASGLERLGGVTTDAELHVRSGIWAAGDTASFYDKSLGRRRIEHWENAQVSGRLAGENMTGAGKAFWYQPAFFSKIAPHWHINAVGITDSSLPTVSVFAKDDNANESFERGVVFYKGDDGKVVGVLLLNVYGSGVDVSRRLIEEARSVDDFQQLAKLYQLYRPAEPEEQEEKKEEKPEKVN